MNVPRRNTYFGQPDYRIYELNKRLQQRTEVIKVNICTFIGSELMNFMLAGK